MPTKVKEVATRTGGQEAVRRHSVKKRPHVHPLPPDELVALDVPSRNSREALTDLLEDGRIVARVSELHTVVGIDEIRARRARGGLCCHYRTPWSLKQTISSQLWPGSSTIASV